MEWARLRLRELDPGWASMGRKSDFSPKASLPGPLISSEKRGAVMGEERTPEYEWWSEVLDEESDMVPMLEPPVLFRLRSLSTWASTRLKLMLSMPFLAL